MGFSAIFFIPRKTDTSVSFFFITSRVLEVVLTVSTVHEHGFVQSRHPGCSFWQKKNLLSALEMFFGGGGALAGLGSFANHRSKNRTFSHFETLQKNQKNNKNTLPRTTQQTGKSKHCWLEEIWRWFSDGVFKKEKKKTWELKCTFLLMAARQEMSRGRRWWRVTGVVHGHAGWEYHRCCWKAWAESSLTLKASLFCLFPGRIGGFWTALEKLLFLKSCLNVLILADPFLSKKHSFAQLLSPPNVLASEATRGQFSSAFCVCVCVVHRQAREITLPPPFPPSPLPRQHYSCLNSIVSSIFAHWAT